MRRFSRFLPSRRWLFLPPIIIGLAILISFAMSKKELPRVDSAERALPLNVIQIQPQSVTPYAVVYGTAEPEQVWTAIAEVGGRIVATHPDLDSGKQLAAGEVLFRIDSKDYDLALAQRQADLLVAKASLEELKASQTADERSLKIQQDLLIVAKADFQRIHRLRHGNAVTDSELDNAEGNLLRQQQSVQTLQNSLSLYAAKIKSAQANVAMVESRVAVARRDVERTVVRCPFAGVIANSSLETNQVVGPGERLFEVQTEDFLEIEAQVSFAQLYRLLPVFRDRDLSCEVGNDPHNGSVERLLSALSTLVSSKSGEVTRFWKSNPVRVAESVSRQTRTLGIVVRVENPRDSFRDESREVPIELSSVVGGGNPSGREPAFLRKIQWSATSLQPGTFCEIMIVGEPIDNAIALPRTAFDGESVYLVDDDNRLRRVPVETGIAIGERIVVISGLRPGQRVAARPPLPAIEGALISPHLVGGSSGLRQDQVDAPTKTASAARPAEQQQ